MADDQISSLQAENQALRQRVERLERWAGDVSNSLAPQPGGPATQAAVGGGSPSRRDMLVALGAGLVGGAAAGAILDVALDSDSSAKSATDSSSKPPPLVSGYRPQPYRDSITGMFLPEGFGSLTDEEHTRSAIQTAIEAASAAGGGAVLLSGNYTVAPNPDNHSYALYTRANVTLAGVDWGASQITLAKDANCSVIAGKGDRDSNGKVAETDFFAVRDLTINGNRSAQSGKVTGHGLYLVRHRHLRLLGVRITECDGNGYHSTGQVAGEGTQVTRPLFVTDLVCDNNNGWGVFSSATNREFHGKGIHVEANGMPDSNEYGGAFLDHSEDIILGLTSRGNHGDGIYIHNVQACHYDNLHSVGNDGFGIYVHSLVESEGRNWQSFTNCASLKAASYRSQPTPSAEVYFTSQPSSYGPSSNSRVDGVHAPGLKSFGGSKPDNRKADWGIYLEAGLDPASLRITNYVPGDGGLKGGLHQA